MKEKYQFNEMEDLLWQQMQKQCLVQEKNLGMFGKEKMNKKFLSADDVASILEVSKGHAYKIIKKLNDELAANGYIVVAGKVPRRYLEERCYCLDI